jgi:hypothetical protein
MVAEHLLLITQNGHRVFSSIKTFESLAEISKEPGFSKGGISSAIRKRSFYKNMFHVSYQ